LFRALAELHADIVAAESAFQKFFANCAKAGNLRERRELDARPELGALPFAMMTGIVVTAPLADQVFQRRCFTDG
jgi:hypothetical protein